MRKIAVLLSSLLLLCCFSFMPDNDREIVEAYFKKMNWSFPLQFEPADSVRFIACGELAGPFDSLDYYVKQYTNIDKWEKLNPEFNKQAQSFFENDSRLDPQYCATRVYNGCYCLWDTTGKISYGVSVSAYCKNKLGKVKPDRSFQIVDSVSGLISINYLFVFNITENDSLKFAFILD